MKKSIGTCIVVMALIMGAFSSSEAVSSYATAFKSKYPSSPLSSLSTQSGLPGNLCTLCHGTSGGSRNTFGSNFASSSIGNHTFNATLEARDSDSDGFTNLAEITAGTFPGNAASKPAAATCTSYTYSAWSACQSNNTQTRTVVTSLPTGCSGGVTPVTSQACTYVPPVTACTSYTYSAWSACQSNNTQTRTVITNLPSGCSGGSTPVTSQACTYVPPQNPGTLMPPASSGLYWDDVNKRLGVQKNAPVVSLDIVGTHLSGTGMTRFTGSGPYGFMTADTLANSGSDESGFLLKIADQLIGQFGVRQTDNSVYIKNRVYGTNEIVTITSSGFVGIGTTTPNEALEVNGGLALFTTEPKPVCNVDTRGTFWFTQDDVAGDSADVCAKVGGVYSWRKLF